MKITEDIKNFIKEYVNELLEGRASLMIGAGMSKASGFVNWKELLNDTAKKLGLDINKETDLLAVAQYDINKRNSKNNISKLILNEFSKKKVEITDNHTIIANLPISTIWTTNYDCLIEKSFEEKDKIIDVKSNVKNLSTHKDKRDVVIYKMHGDINSPTDTIIAKQDYEKYYFTHEPFIEALQGELITKTFLFIGFSFADPNINYVLSRLNLKHEKEKIEHYCFLKKPDDNDFKNKDELKYQKKKQELLIKELGRYGITALMIDSYNDITQILKLVEKKYKQNSIFISGSAVEYGDIGEKNATDFIHILSKKLIENGYRIINGFGLGVGSAVINGALDAIYSKNSNYTEDQLVLRPFPQFKTGDKKLKDLWEEYRYKMISMAGISLILFGNKKDPSGKTINADGVKKEFKIAIKDIKPKLIPIPMAFTGYMSKEIFEKMKKNKTKDNILSPIKLSDIENIKIKGKQTKKDIENTVNQIINLLNKIKEQY